MESETGIDSGRRALGRRWTGPSRSIGATDPTPTARQPTPWLESASVFVGGGGGGAAKAAAAAKANSSVAHGARRANATPSAYATLPRALVAVRGGSGGGWGGLAGGGGGGGGGAPRGGGGGVGEGGGEGGGGGGGGGAASVNVSMVTLITQFSRDR